MDIKPSAHALATPARPPENAAAKSARDFEAMLMGQVVDTMMATVKTGSFGGGHAEETWRSVLSNAIGESIADRGGIGIARQVETAIARYRDGAGT